jgi:glutathione S-transferase
LVSTITNELDPNLWVHRKHEALSKMFGAAPIAVAEAKRNFAIVLKVLATELWGRGGALLLGEFSAADILLGHCLDWGEGIEWLEPALAAMDNTLAEHLREYRARCMARPAYQRAVASKQHKPAKL